MVERGSSAQALFRELVGRVGNATGKAVGKNQSVFELEDASLELVPVAWNNSSPAVLFVFTLTGFRVGSAATLAQLLHLNRQLLHDCELPACFCLDESGLHVQFQQRMRLDEMPLWALQRYVEDSLSRLRDLFVVVAKPTTMG